MGFAVCVLAHRDNPHIEAFRETADVLTQALRDLGYSAVRSWRPLQTELDGFQALGIRPIVLWANQAPALGLQLPAHSVIYNLEQSSRSRIGNGPFPAEFVDLLKRYVVWDYNAWNIEQLRERYAVHASHVPLGDTVPSTLRRFERRPPEQRDIDVLMFGYSAPGDRRDVLAQQMRKRGMTVVQIGLDDGKPPEPRTAELDYGAGRNALLARCKIVVNAHCHDSHAPFESARAALCLAHGVPLLSESSLAPDEWAVPTDQDHGVHFADAMKIWRRQRRCSSQPIQRAAVLNGSRAIGVPNGSPRSPSTMGSRARSRSCQRDRRITYDALASVAEGWSVREKSAPMNLYYSPTYITQELAFDTTRKAGWIAAHLAQQPIAGVTLVAPTPLTAAEVVEVHAPDYVEAVRTGRSALAQSSGLGWSADTFPAVCASNGGAVAAVGTALATGRPSG
jgi:hypothetical protein